MSLFTDDGMVKLHSMKIEEAAGEVATLVNRYRALHGIKSKRNSSEYRALAAKVERGQSVMAYLRRAIMHRAMYSVPVALLTSA